MDKKTFNIIDRIAREHAGPAYRKKFGYLSEEDLVNEIWVICLEQLPEFKSSEGNLENFLRVVTKNRLVNRHKSLTKSVKSPCPTCPYFAKHENPNCVMFGHDKHQCEKFRIYDLSRESRNALLNSVEADVEREGEDRVLDVMVGKELINDVREKIPKKYRRDFDRFVNKEGLSRLKFKRIRREVKKIINDDFIQKFNQEQKLTQLTINGGQDARCS